MRVAGVVDNHRLDVTPLFAFADPDQLLPKLGHLDLAPPYDSRVLLRPRKFCLLLLDLLPDAVRHQPGPGVEPEEIRLWHLKPQALVTARSICARVPRMRSLSFPFVT